MSQPSIEAALLILNAEASGASLVVALATASLEKFSCIEIEERDVFLTSESGARIRLGAEVTREDAIAAAAMNVLVVKEMFTSSGGSLIDHREYAIDAIDLTTAHDADRDAERSYGMAL